jgi:hypothetical protein
MKTAMIGVLGASLVMALPNISAAQGFTVTPTLGVFIPASDLRELRETAAQARLERSGTLGLGLKVEAGWLRGSLAYATGATLTDRGVTNRGEIGDGSVLAAAADVVMRPLPRVVVQPYLLGGVGVKRQDYSYNDDQFGDIFPREKTDLALHLGIGADASLGGFGIMAEISDFVSRRPDDSFGQHDAFAMVGLTFRLGGR